MNEDRLRDLAFQRSHFYLNGEVPVDFREIVLRPKDTMSVVLVPEKVGSSFVKYKLPNRDPSCPLREIKVLYDSLPENLPRIRVTLEILDEV